MCVPTYSSKCWCFEGGGGGGGDGNKKMGGNIPFFVKTKQITQRVKMPYGATAPRCQYYMMRRIFYFMYLALPQILHDAAHF